MFLKTELSVSTRSNCVVSRWPTVFLSRSLEGHRVQRVNSAIPDASQHVNEQGVVSYVVNTENGTSGLSWPVI